MADRLANKQNVNHSYALDHGLIILRLALAPPADDHETLNKAGSSSRWTCKNPEPVIFVDLELFFRAKLEVVYTNLPTSHIEPSSQVETVVPQKSTVV